MSRDDVAIFTIVGGTDKADLVCVLADGIVQSWELFRNELGLNARRCL